MFLEPQVGLQCVTCKAASPAGSDVGKLQCNPLIAAGAWCGGFLCFQAEKGELISWEGVRPSRKSLVCLRENHFLCVVSTWAPAAKWAVPRAQDEWDSPGCHCPS